MKQNGIMRMFWFVPVLAILVGLSACTNKMTPPGADMVFGSLAVPEGLVGSYTILQWNEGLLISVIDDSQGAHESSGSSSTEDPIWRGQGSIGSENGQIVTWRVETTDGKRARFSINEQPYDLAQGTLFLIKTNNGSPEITQHQNHQNETCSDDESCQQILRQDPAVLQFIQETLELTDQPSPTEMQPGPTGPSPVVISEALISAGWVTHSSQQCEYTISYPAEMQVQSQTPYSDLFILNSADPDEGARNFIYMSVIAPEVKRMAEQGVYNHDVYNYDPAATETLLNMQVGENRSVHASANVTSGFTFQREPDTTISGHAAQTYENLRPWEFPEGTKEIRYYLSLDGCTYLIGGYVNTAGSTQAGTITEGLFTQIIATIQLIP